MNKKKVFKNAILIISCIGIAIGGALSFVSFDFNREMTKSPMSWEAFVPDDGRFEAQFPTDPVKHERELHIANKKIDLNEYSVEVDSSLYAVSYLDFPGTWKLLGTNKLLNTAFENLMAQEQNVDEIISQELSNHNGHSSLEYHFKEGEKEVKGILIVAGNTLYRVTISYPLAAAEKLNPNTFLESFQING